MRNLGGRKQKKRVGADAYVFAALSLVSFSILLFSARSFVIDFKNLGLSLFSGVRGGISGVSSFVSRTVLSIQELATLRREYAELTGRMTRYEQIERSAAEIRQENKRLREQLGFSEVLRFRHIPAELIGRDPDNLFSAFVINKGKRNGVADNMPVIAYQDGIQALVGKVIQAGQFESLVMPVYDLSFYVSSRLSESRYEGLVEGQGSPEAPLLMRLIRKRARDEINFGDIIVTSGIGGLYPPGITIGRVNKILYQEYETSMEVELEASVDFSRLEYVFVIDVEPRPESSSLTSLPEQSGIAGPGGEDG
ncbi:MAG: rod shape-determining protein MreC [Spirochaetaceae bacterium]|jgi:rod shape-determining protein MreC|nr:rod shape-determining protein MreC [Spirochaetaceae bacterium]